MEALQEQTDTLVRELQALPGLTSVATQFRSKTPQLWLDIDRNKVASLGVSFDDLNQTLSMYLGSLLCQQLQFLRPALAGDRSGRGSVPQPDRGHQPVPGKEQVAADGSPRHAGPAAQIGGPISVTR